MVKVSTFLPPVVHASRIPVHACVRLNGRPVIARSGWWQACISGTDATWIIGLHTTPSPSFRELATAQQHSSVIDVRTLDGGLGRVALSRWGGPDYCLIGFGKWFTDPTTAQRRIDLSIDVTDPQGEECRMATLAQAVRTRRMGLLWLQNGICLEVERLDVVNDDHVEIIDGRDGQRLTLARADLAWWIPQA